MTATRPTLESSRRAALGAVAAAGLGFALWPIRPKSESNIPRGGGRTVLQYWEKWTGVEGDALQRVVDQFNHSQDRIWVARVPVSDIETKAMVAIGGGDPPDLVGLYSYSIPLFAESRAIMAMDEFAALAIGPDEPPLAPAHYAPAVWKLLTHEGRQWAGVNTCYTLALYYNRTAFREAGLNPDQPPRTINALDDAAARLTRKNSDGSIRQLGFMPRLPHWWPYFWPIMFDGALYDPATDAAPCTTPESIRAYEWIARYPATFGRRELDAFATTFGRSFHSAQDPFISGRAAMIVQGPWLANFIRRFAPSLDFAAVPVPLTTNAPDPQTPRGMLEADVLLIPRGCPHPAEAWEFFRFMQRRRTQEQLASDHCKSSPLASVSPGFIASHPNPFVSVHDAIVKSPRVQILPQTRVWPQYASLLLGAFDAIWAGANAQSELSKVQQRVSGLLTSTATMRARRTAS